MRLGRARGCNVTQGSAAHHARVTDLNGRIDRWHGVEVLVVTIAVEVAVVVAAGGALTPRGRALTPGSATRRTVAERYGNRDVVAITFVSVGMVVDVDMETVAVLLLSWKLVRQQVWVLLAALLWSRR